MIKGVYVVGRNPNWRSISQTLPSIAAFLCTGSLALIGIAVKLDTKSLGVIHDTRKVAICLLTATVLCLIYSAQAMLRAQAYNYFDLKPDLSKRIRERISVIASKRG